MAPSAPTTIDASAAKMMICRQASTSPAKGSIAMRTSTPIAATLGALAKKAVTGVGAPS